MNTITCTELNLLKAECEATGKKVTTELHTEPLTDNEERISWRDRQKLNPAEPWKATTLGANAEVTGVPALSARPVD